MTPSLLYARKHILPSLSASALQSMNMAAAFAGAGVAVYSYPGIRTVSAGPDGKTRLTGKDALAVVLEQYGLDPAAFEHCRPLPAFNKGAYGLAYRVCALKRYLHGNEITFARDVADGLLVAFARTLCGKRKKRGLFLYEMHEALFAMHKDQPHKFDWRKTRQQEKKILAAADGIIAVNRDIAETARADLRYYGSYLVEPNGFNPDLFAPLPLFTPQHPWPGPEDEVCLVYIGNMHESKGVAELIQAMDLLPRRFRLRIMGGGGQTAVAAMRQLAASVSHGAGRIQFTGHLPQKDLRQACAGAHMAVIPQQPGVAYFSPIKFNESLALGLPLVITPLPVFSDRKHLAHNARDCAPEGLAAAIAELAASPARARDLRAAGLAEAAGHTWLARARRILDFAEALA